MDYPHVGVVAHGLPGQVDQTVKTTSGKTSVNKLTLLDSKKYVIMCFSSSLITVCFKSIRLHNLVNIRLQTGPRMPPKILML